ncbi:MAG: Hsp20/alpha crystallin family protein [Lachnospiraceae bacterium]|nr:Hsp20/alpha crystallin family protein [Lachnospiraceae bacterium]
MYLPSIFGDNLMDDFFDDFDRSFFKPARPVLRTERTDLMKTDIRETENGYELDVELPGYKKEDLNLELTNGYLTISASKNTDNEEKDTEGRVIRKERYIGSMKRSFFVGKDITEEDIKARFEDGILKLGVPKKEVKEQIPEKKTIMIEG